MVEDGSQGKPRSEGRTRVLSAIEMLRQVRERNVDAGPLQH
jgi:hypothetical protein